MDLTTPLIGICGVTATATWGFWSRPVVLTAQTYLDAVIGAGGQPVILAPSADADVARLLSLLDGLVLAGGTDIDPVQYGETSTGRTEETHPVRDAFEIALTVAALDAATHHPVDIEADSVLGRRGLAGRREINSHHHQGISVVGAGGRVIATSLPDRGVEAVEWPGLRFALGVRWHPEDPPMHAIFTEFAAAAARFSEPVTTVGAP